MNITVAPMTATHIESLAALEQACFADPWSAQALREELHNPCAAFLVAIQNEQVVGYLGCHHIEDEGYITNVATDPTYRRRGIARHLLTYAVTEWQHLSRITLEVRVSNTPAIALYEQAGFVRDGVRPRFYSHPTEDAAIYSYYR